MTTEDDERARGRRILVLAVLTALVAWFGAVVQGGFAYDDRAAIFDNPAVAGELAWSEAFRRDYWHHRGDAGHYRPLATWSLRLDHAIYGDRAWGYHATNVILHAGVVLLLGLALLGLDRRRTWPLLGLFVLAAHPVLADAVAWISGRTSMLSALGGALALLAAVRGRSVWALVFGVEMGLLLGLLGKEDAVVFALPCLLVAGSRSRKALVSAGVGVVLAVAVYLLLRARALGAPLPQAPHAPLAEQALGERLLYAGRSLLEAFRLLVFPVFHPPSYRAAAGFHPGSPPGAWALLGWLPWLALVAGGTWAFLRGVRRNRSGLALAGASAALAALSLVPVLQLVPAGEVFAPRFLYLPILLGVPALGGLLRRVPWPILIVLVAAWAVLAWERSSVYAGREAWNRRVLEHVPGDVGARNNLGLALEERGDFDGAIRVWQDVIRRRPGYGRAWSNLGRLALEFDELERAERYFRRSVQVSRKDPVARANLGSVLLRQDRWSEAEAVYRDALRVAPGFAPAWRGLGRALWRQERLDAAEEALREALRLAPGDAGARQLLQRVREARGG